MSVEVNCLPHVLAPHSSDRDIWITDASSTNIQINKDIESKLPGKECSFLPLEQDMHDLQPRVNVESDKTSLNFESNKDEELIKDGKDKGDEQTDDGGKQGTIKDSATPVLTKTNSIKSTESRSLYHSIQELSSSSSKPKIPATQMAYKIDAYLSHPGLLSSKDENQHTTVGDIENTLSSEGDDDQWSSKERFSENIRSNGCCWRRSSSPENECLFSDEEELLQPKYLCRYTSEDNISDLEMSDGRSGSQSCSESITDGQQKELQSAEEYPEQEMRDDFGANDIVMEERIEAKKARVENIIKTMTQSPSHRESLNTFPVCQDFPQSSILMTEMPETCNKIFSLGTQHSQVTETRRPKRKQYIPQQVDPRSDQQDLPPAKVYVVERDAMHEKMVHLEEELRTMHKQWTTAFRNNVMNEEEHGPEKLESRKMSGINRNDVKDVSKEQKKIFGYGGKWALDKHGGKRILDAMELARSDRAAPTSLEHLVSLMKSEITDGVGQLIDSLIKKYFTKFSQTISKDISKETDPKSSKGVVLNHYDVNSCIEDEEKSLDNHVKWNGTSENGFHDLKMRDNISRRENQQMRDRSLLSAKDDLTVEEIKRRVLTPESDGIKRNVSTPEFETKSSKLTDFRAVSSHLPTMPPVLSLPLSIHSSILDHGKVSRSYDREKPREKYQKKYFDQPRAFGMPHHQSSLSIIGPHHPPSFAFYPPCVGKIQEAFMKDQDQMEPIPLIVSPPKKPKRTKVIDRVSPRASRPALHETTVQMDEESRQNRTVDSPGKPFHLHPHYHPAAGSLHDTFPHPSLLPFGLVPSLAMHPPGFQQHSKFLQAVYSQLPAIGHPENGSIAIHSNGQKSPLCGPSNLVCASKSYQKCESEMAFDPMSDSMVTVGGHGFASTLTPMHLRKAKLMFFYVRYPSSSILKVYFPDVKFNKNNTAQLVKWFSNFREFYYIQMEKYARQALAEGIKNAKDLIVTTDTELYRILVVHYNRNSQIQVPENFRFVVQSTLQEFYLSLAAEKDQEPSWKKAIYKVIARMDDTVPEYFKSPNWMEELADG